MRIRNGKIVLTLAEQCDEIGAMVDMALAENFLIMKVEKLSLPKASTARGLALLNEDGWATPKQWKRANKRLNKMGM